MVQKMSPPSPAGRRTPTAGEEGFLLQLARRLWEILSAFLLPFFRLSCDISAAQGPISRERAGKHGPHGAGCWGRRTACSVGGSCSERMPNSRAEEEGCSDGSPSSPLFSPPPSSSSSLPLLPPSVSPPPCSFLLLHPASFSRGIFLSLFTCLQPQGFCPREWLK